MREAEIKLHPDVAARLIWPETDSEIAKVSDGIVTPCQTHTVNVGIVESPDQTFPDTDALITQLPGVKIGVRTADCVPIVLYAPDIKAVAAIHAGWKGTLYGIVANTLQRLFEMGADARKIRAAFGPYICGDCYEVSPELAKEFQRQGFYSAIRCGETTDPLTGKAMDPERPHIDLGYCNLVRLRRGLVPDDNIIGPAGCTRHSGEFPSWRRENGTDKRMITWISLPPT